MSFVCFMHHFTCWTLFISRINRAIPTGRNLGRIFCPSLCKDLSETPIVKNSNETINFISNYLHTVNGSYAGISHLDGRSYTKVNVIQNTVNKEVLLRERKRHTACRVATPWGYLPQRGGYLPWLEGVPTLNGRGTYLGLGGNYFGRGMVPTLARGYLPWLGHWPPSPPGVDKQRN